MKQREMPLIAEVKQPELLTDADIKRCTNVQEAIKLCIWRSRTHYTQNHLAELLGIDQGYFSRCLNGTGNFPPNKLPKLQELCGNYAVTQFMTYSCGFELVRPDNGLNELRALRQQIDVMENSLLARQA